MKNGGWQTQKRKLCDGSKWADGCEVNGQVDKQLINKAFGLLIVCLIYCAVFLRCFESEGAFLSIPSPALFHLVISGAAHYLSSA